MTDAKSLDPETRAALEEARQLIKAREGKKAALLLHTIDHPVARKWERQINQAVDWNRQPDIIQTQERGPMPWYLWMFMPLPVIISAGIWFAAVGGRAELFLILCLIAIVVRIPSSE